MLVLFYEKNLTFEITEIFEEVTVRKAKKPDVLLDHNAATCAKHRKPLSKFVSARLFYIRC